MDDLFPSFRLIDTINRLTNLIPTDLSPSSENADISTRLKSLNGLLTDIATLAVDEKIK
jgi:hypothetical protein